jgi:4'-phosphopantetheinyl transferase EntD
LSPDVQALFPAGAIAAQMRTPGNASELFPAEAEHVSRAVPKRVQEYAAGRTCARRALAEFGFHDYVLRTAGDRQPVWPESMVGSISHTTGFCVAVVGARNRFLALGVDSEVVGAASTDIWATVCGPEESLWLDSLPNLQQPAAVTLLFCAKEAFYKCQYPLTGEWLDFHDLRVEPLDWGPARSAFAVHPVRPLAAAPYATAVVGQYLFHDGLVTAGVGFAS